MVVVLLPLQLDHLSRSVVDDEGHPGFVRLVPACIVQRPASVNSAASQLQWLWNALSLNSRESETTELLKFTTYGITCIGAVVCHPDVVALFDRPVGTQFWFLV